MSNYLFDTFGTVVDEAYDELTISSDTENSYPALARSEMEKWANRFSKQFLSEVDIKSREGTYTFTTVADTTLSAAASSGATSLTITSATGWPASGLCLVDAIPMTFTRSSTTLTVSAITRDFDSGASVQLGYAVPSDFLRPRSFFLEGTEYYLQRRGFDENVAQFRFAIYDDYIVMPPATTGSQDVTLHYVKKGTNTLADTDTMQIMDMFTDFVIFSLVARGHRVMLDTNAALEYERLATEAKQRAKKHFQREDGNPASRRIIPDF